MKIRNIIFDCNGTMIFDGKYHDIAWRTYVSKLAGRELTKEEFQHQILFQAGNFGKVDLAGRYHPGTAASKIHHLGICPAAGTGIDKHKQEDQDACRLVKGLPEFLDELQRRNIKCNIATASGLSNVDFYFERFALAKSATKISR